MKILNLLHTQYFLYVCQVAQMPDICEERTLRILDLNQVWWACSPSTLKAGWGRRTVSSSIPAYATSECKSSLNYTVIPYLKKTKKKKVNNFKLVFELFHLVCSDLYPTMLTHCGSHGNGPSRPPLQTGTAD